MKEIGAVLLLEGDRQSAGLEQAEDVAGGGVGEPALVGDDVVLGAVAGRDVVLGDDASTRSVEPSSRWIFLVLPSVTSAPSANFDMRSGVFASTARILDRKETTSIPLTLRPCQTTMFTRRGIHKLQSPRTRFRAAWPSISGRAAGEVSASAKRPLAQPLGRLFHDAEVGVLLDVDRSRVRSRGRASCRRCAAALRGPAACSGRGRCPSW